MAKACPGRSSQRRRSEEARDEMTDYTTYKRLASSEKSQTNRDMFEKLSAMEHRHYDLWMKYRPQGTGR